MKFFGEWFNKKYPLNIEKNPEYHYDDKIWLEVSENIRKKIIENAMKTRAKDLSIIFWAVVLVGILFIGLPFLLAILF